MRLASRLVVADVPDITDRTPIRTDPTAIASQSLMVAPVKADAARHRSASVQRKHHRLAGVVVRPRSTLKTTAEREATRFG